MSTIKKKPQKQVPPEEQIVEAVEAIPGVIPGSVEIDRPMAAPEPAIEDRVRALELANLELEKRIGKIDTFILRVARDHSYQYGGTT